MDYEWFLSSPLYVSLFSKVSTISTLSFLKSKGCQRIPTPPWGGHRTGKPWPPAVSGPFCWCHALRKAASPLQSRVTPAGPRCPVKYIEQGQPGARGRVASADLAGEWALCHPGPVSSGDNVHESAWPKSKLYPDRWLWAYARERRLAEHIPLRNFTLCLLLPSSFLFLPPLSRNIFSNPIWILFFPLIWLRS